MGDTDRWFCRLDRHLRRHTARPKNGDLAVLEIRKIAPIWSIDIANTDLRRVTDMDGLAVGMGKTIGNRASADRIDRTHRTHRYDHFAAERSGGSCRNVRAVHGDDFVIVDMPKTNAPGNQGFFKRKRTPENKRDKIFRPKVRYLGFLLTKLTIPIDVVFGHIRTNVDVTSERKEAWISCVGNPDKGTGFWISLTETEKVQGVGRRQDRQVSLQISQPQPRRLTGIPARTDGFPDLRDR